MASFTDVEKDAGAGVGRGQSGEGNVCSEVVCPLKSLEDLHEGKKADRPSVVQVWSPGQRSRCQDLESPPQCNCFIQLYLSPSETLQNSLFPDNIQPIRQFRMHNIDQTSSNFH